MALNSALNRCRGTVRHCGVSVNHRPDSSSLCCSCWCSHVSLLFHDPHLCTTYPRVSQHLAVRLLLSSLFLPSVFSPLFPFISDSERASRLTIGGTWQSEVSCSPISLCLRRMLQTAGEVRDSAGRVASCQGVRG